MKKESKWAQNACANANANAYAYAKLNSKRVSDVYPSQNVGQKRLKTKHKTKLRELALTFKFLFVSKACTLLNNRKTYFLNYQEIAL